MSERYNEKAERLIGGGISEAIEPTSDEYEAAGYLDFYNDIDARIVGEIPCTYCGGKCTYRGLRHPRTGSYLAFAICNDCKRETGF